MVDERDELEFQTDDDEEQEQLDYEDINQTDQVNCQVDRNTPNKWKKEQLEMANISDDETVFQVIDRKK